MKHFCALVRKYGTDMYRLGFVGRRRRVEMVLLDHGTVHLMRRLCRKLSIRPLRDTCMSPAPTLSQDDWPLVRKAAELGRDNALQERASQLSCHRCCRCHVDG